MLARKIIESLNVSPIYFIVAFNLSQNLSLIAGICIYDCKPIQLGTTLSIHRSTQTIALSYLTQKLDLTHNKEHLSTIAGILEAYINESLDKEDSLRSRFLIMHYEVFLSHNNLFTDTIRGTIGSALGGTYDYLGYRNFKTKQLLEESLTNLNKHYSSNTAQIALALAHLGSVYRSLGNDKKAKDLLEQSILIYKKHHKNHIGSARAMAYLGNIYRILGNCTKAKDLLEQSILIYKKHHKNHIGSARAMAYLGVVYRDLGDYEKAKNVLEQSLIIYKENPEHLNNGLALTYLGNVYRELGDYKKAKNVLEQSLIIYKNHCSKNHLNIGWVLSHLAIVYSTLGDYKEAADLLEQSLIIYKQHYAEQKDHPNVAWILVNLGNTYRELGRHQQAKDLLEQSIVIHKKHYDHEHIDVGWNLLYLGVVYRDLGDYKKARNALEQSLIIYNKNYGDGHIQTARVLNALGETYLVEGRNLGSSETFLLNALKIFETTKHPETYMVLANLSALYVKKATEAISKRDIQSSQYFKKQAITYLKQAQEIIKVNVPEPSFHSTRIQSKLKELESLN